MNKIIVGLTGGIASGKSKAAERFYSLGADVIDADKISREVIEKGSSGYDKVVKAFPHVVFDGVIDRSKLRDTVFGNKSELEKLNAITHPLIHSRIKESAEKSQKRIVILMVPLLFEIGMNKEVDKIISVLCSEEKRIERLIKRDNITRELANKIINLQATDEMRKALSDYIIINETDEQTLITQVENIYKSLTEL